MKLSCIIPELMLLALLGTGCDQPERLRVPDHPLLHKLAPPITLRYDSTVILLADYFGRPDRVDSIVAALSLRLIFSADSSILILKPITQDIPFLSTLRVWSGGFSYDLVLTRSPEVSVKVTYDPGRKRCRKVELAGQINDWTPSRTPLQFHDGIWETTLLLFPGNYQYQVVADGTWMLDPANPDSASNGIGGYNSVLRAGTLSELSSQGIYTEERTGGKIVIGGTGAGSATMALWQNYRIPEQLLHFDTTGLTIEIPENARLQERSFIRIWAAGPGSVTNDLLIPLQRGKVITHPAELTRTDKETMIFYFMLVDRFYDGNPGNDKRVNDPEVAPKVNYMGGDLEGILEKLREGYFTSLGVNTLWISPITQNPWTAYHEFPPPHRKFSGYHGYWPVSLTSIDPRFGSPEVLKELVAESHRDGINVVLDFVAHHVHQDYPLLASHPDWITQVDLPDGRKNIRIWDECRLTTWFDSFLPTLDLSKPEVYELVSDSATYWVSEYELDGFRHDAAKHVPEVFWRTLTRKLDSVLQRQNREFYQIGETFGSRELIKSYINPGMMDAQFDFNLYWEVRNAFAFDNGSFEDLNTALLQSLAFFGSHHLMGNITGNQDMARFISYADGSLSTGEEDREAGWVRTIEVRDPVGYRRLASLMAFNMTIPGVPVIYYGDEFGLPGANDPDNRRMMKFDGLTENELLTLEQTRALTRLRSDHMALLYGDFQPLLVSRDQYVYLRSYFDDVVIIAFNKAREDTTVAVPLPSRVQAGTLKPAFGSIVEIADNQIQINLKANSFEILVH